jgi:hypothetical protein
MGEGRNVYRVLVGKPEGKRPLENQGIDGWMGGVEWIHLAQDRDHWQAVMNAVMSLLSGTMGLVS